MCALILYMCPHTTICVSSYYYIIYRAELPRDQLIWIHRKKKISYKGLHFPATHLPQRSRGQLFKYIYIYKITNICRAALPRDALAAALA